MIPSSRRPFPGAPRRARRRARPAVETLEVREVPATFTVAAGDVYGPAGLVADLNAANANYQANTIVLAAGSTYTLTQVNNFWFGPTGLPPVSSTLTIEGNGAVLRRDPAPNG